jgi:hypothetical protein
MAEGEGKSILDRLIEEAAAKGKELAQEGDFAVNLTTTDEDGHAHSVQGIPVSQAAGFLHKFFGIGDAPGDEGEGEGQGDEGGKGKPGGGGGATPLKRYFGQTG